MTSSGLLVKLIVLMSREKTLPLSVPTRRRLESRGLHATLTRLTLSGRSEKRFCQREECRCERKREREEREREKRK